MKQAPSATVRRKAIFCSWASFATAAFALMPLVSAQSPAPAALEKDLSAAQMSFAQHQYQDASRLAASVAAKTTNSQQRLRAFMLNSKSLVNLGDFSAADSVLHTYLQLKEDSPEALYLLAYVLERENKPKESLEIYTRAAAVAAPQPNDLKLVALDYVLLDDYPDAVHWLERSLAADPTNAEAWYFLGRAHIHDGAFVEAERDFRRALSLTPGDAKASDNLGLALEGQNRNEEAAVAYRDAIAKQNASGHPTEQPLLNLGTLLNNENQSSEAVGLLENAVAFAPENVRCHDELSRAYAAVGKQAEAIEAMRRAVKLDPGNARLHFRLGQLYRHAGQKAEAEAEIQMSTRLYGTHSTDAAH